MYMVDFLFQVIDHMDRFKKYLRHIHDLLAAKGIAMQVNGNVLLFRTTTKELRMTLSDEKSSATDGITLPADLLVTATEKIASLIFSKMGANKVVFARKCTVKKTDKQTATVFLDKYHLLGATSSATNLGLYLDNELMALASFSNGRKMNRLAPDQRSYELLRFCCLPGITVAGGLTRLVRNFCEMKKAGDVMTYIDKQFADGKTFLTAGFKKHSDTEPLSFLVNKKNFERIYKIPSRFDEAEFYLAHNQGNIKMIFTP